MIKYFVTLKRRIKNITSTLGVMVEASHIGKASWIAEQSTNSEGLSNWRTYSVKKFSTQSDLSNDIDP